MFVFDVEFLAFFCDVGSILGGPGGSKNQKKTPKKRSKKNTWFSTPFFLDFSWFRPPKTTPKSRFFRCFFENGNFVKIMVFPKENCYFSGFGPLGNNAKSEYNRIRERLAKKLTKKVISFRFWDHFGRPKIIQNSKRCPWGLQKIHQKAFKMTPKEILARVLDASFFEGGFGEGFGRVLGGFLVDF